ncbi:Asp23/Gls24 family envelope stress response protein [Caloramator sp. E03]|uniref:Asp23/Gls24 family envelope stress response protein n=1 Tax=Caloramator sp. E03 TaxID=2576307 RepID=UPI0011108103|nr:Asp23/Gls24 family envelope stress response protein [Caloramator sp. E03]QCX32700.1 Asp23/Gls24 family envelope stress response protein [Caloramator sp. E03]
MDENTTIISEVGEVKIAPEVVNVIASLAATEVKGVAGMSGGFTDDIAEKFGMKSSNKGIKVQLGEEQVTIDLFLIIEYGFRIPEVAWEVQQNVKKAVETMTGLKVVEVNIHVQGINIQRESKEEEIPKKTK